MNAGVSQRELARSAGVTPAMIQQTEAGKRQPGLSSLEKIATALGVPFETLRQGAPPESDAEELLSDRLTYETARRMSQMTLRERQQVSDFAEFIARKKFERREDDAAQ
jgi:transcriptional regulator with XRE-family HTH domain